MTTVVLDLETPATGVIVYSRTDEPDLATARVGDSVELEPSTVEWVWLFVERTSNGVRRRWCQVPASGTVQYLDLVDVDPDTLVPTSPVVPVWQDALDLKENIADLDGDTAANVADDETATGVAVAANQLQGLTDPGTRRDAVDARVTLGITAADIPGQISDEIATNPDVIADAAAAAAALAASDAGLVREDDPGAPRAGSWEVAGVLYEEVTLDAADKMSDGTLTDGTRHLPRLRADSSFTDPRSTTAASGPVEVEGELYEYVEVDAAGYVAYAERADGTRFIGRLKVGRQDCYWTGKTIVVVGTSITEGYNAPLDGSVRTGFVTKALRDDINATVDNEGVASSRIMWLGNNALSLGATQAELTGAGYDPAQSYEVKVLGKDADLYIFDHGYNDRTGTIGTIADSTAATFYGAYNKVIDALLAEKPTAQIAFLTPPSLYTPAGGGLNAGTVAVRAAILALAEKYNAPVLDMSMRAQLNATQVLPFASDTIHPDTESHTRMARQLAAFVRGL